MKTIPFDIEKAKAGAKVVSHVSNNIRIVCYDRKNGQPIIALHTDNSGAEVVRHHELNGCYYSETTSCYDDLMLQIETTLRPWKTEEVPVGARLRYKNGMSNHYLILAAGDKGLIFINGIGIVTHELLSTACDRMEHSTDQGKTWLPCGVEE